MHKKLYIGLATASILGMATWSTTHAQALGDQWYVGAGAGVSFLKPKSDDESDSLKLDSDQDTIASFYFGRDFDHLSSGQVQLYSLGEAKFDNEQIAEFQGAEASLLYRFYDSRDNRRGRPVRGTSFYGRFGVGYLERESDIELKNDTPVYFGLGAGLESYLNNNLGLRLEAQYFDTDAAAATLSLVARFGGYRSKLLASIEIPGEQLAPAVVAPKVVTPADTSVAATDNREIVTDTTARIDAADTEARAEVELLDTADDSTYIARVPIAPADTDTDSGIEADPDSSSVTGTMPEPDITPESATDGSDNALATREGKAAIPEVQIMADATELGDNIIEQPTVETPATQATTQAATDSATASAAAELKYTDSDSDSITDDLDKCPDSTNGFPVNRAGCSVFEGTLAGLQFSADQSAITEGAENSLDGFARLLSLYPRSRIEIIAHTDNTGTEAQQSSRTRTRLRAIGTYLVARGATTDQMILRSFGGKRPIADNGTEAGRRANNRIEIFERPR